MRWLSITPDYTLVALDAVGVGLLNSIVGADAMLLAATVYLSERRRRAPKRPRAGHRRGRRPGCVIGPRGVRE